MDYLIIAAHPDDEVLGCGGSIAKWTANGDKVNILIAAEGITSRDNNRNIGKRKNALSDLRSSSQKAAKILGANSVSIFDFPDNRMDSIDLLDVVKKIGHHIEKLRPQIIVTHHAGDLNIDHQIIHKAVITFCRPQPSFYVKKILTFEIPSSTEWQSPQNNTPFIPNWFEDITITLDKKIKALNAYKSEMRNWPHSRSVESIKYLSKWRGASVGLEAAESFMLVRNIT